MAKKKIGGRVVVLVTKVDDCGRVLDAVVEQSSLQPDLDVAALQSARQWVVPRDQIDPRSQDRVARVPIEFHGSKPGLPIPPKLFSMQLVSAETPASPPLDESMSLMDVFVADPNPFPFDSVAKARAYAEKNAHFTGTTADGMAFYMIDVPAANGSTRGSGGWYFLPAGSKGYPAVLWKRQMVFHGEASYLYLAYNHLCEGTEEDCRAYSDWVREHTAMPVPLRRTPESSAVGD